jgi:predicted RecA/RadA family phage recombinase
MAAGELVLKGCFVSLDASGNAIAPVAGRDAYGVAISTVDNRLGIAGDRRAEVYFGPHEFLTSDTILPGQVVYMVDNQTVSVTEAGSFGLAGVATEQKTSGKVTVLVSPATIAAVRGSAQVFVPVGALRLSTGAAIPAFSNGVADGFEYSSTKALGLRINDDSTTVFVGECVTPASLPLGASCKMIVYAAKVGTTDTTGSLTPHVFTAAVGVAYDAGSDLVSGDFGNLTATTKVITRLTKTLTSAPTAGSLVSFSLVANAALANDDLIIYGVKFVWE